MYIHTYICGHSTLTTDINNTFSFPHTGRTLHIFSFWDQLSVHPKYGCAREIPVDQQFVCETLRAVRPLNPLSSPR